MRFQDVASVHSLSLLPSLSRGGLAAPCLALVLGALGCQADNEGVPDAGALPAYDASGEKPVVCTGVTPPESAWSAKPSPPAVPDAGTGDLDAGADGGTDGGSVALGSVAFGPAVGEPPPAWVLRDLQPQSCGYDAVYGLAEFEGHVTVAAILAAS